MSPIKKWWHLHPELRFLWWGFTHPSVPVPPWQNDPHSQQLRVDVFTPVIAEIRRDEQIARGVTADGSEVQQ